MLYLEMFYGFTTHKTGVNYLQNGSHFKIHQYRGYD